MNFRNHNASLAEPTYYTILIFTILLDTQLYIITLFVDLSLKRWPVRGLVNHLTYKNVFCAMCNGIDPQASVRFSDQMWFGDPNKINDSVSTMEWWPAKVECDAEAIEEYLSSDTDHKRLITLVKE